LRGAETLPPSCADNLEIPVPQTPRIRRASPGLYKSNFTFETSTYAFILLLIASFVEQSFFCHLQLAETDTTSTAVPNASETPSKEPPGCGNSADAHHTCYNCTYAPICIPIESEFIDFGPVNCAELNASTPYCNNGVCSAKASDLCPTPPSEFICTSNGYFPDPDDCRKFYFCVKGKATEYRCSINYVYNHQKNACVRQSVSSDCAVIKCKYTSIMEYVLYPKDPNVYGLCIRDHKTLMFKCPEEEQFDTKISQCSFVCKKEGLFAVPGNARKYRECVSVGVNKFELYERECPVDSTFDAVKGRCVVTRKSVVLRRWK